MRFSDISIRTKMIVFVVLVLFFNTITLIVMNIMDDTHQYDTVFMKLSEQNKSYAQQVLSLSDLSVSNDFETRQKTTKKLFRYLNKFENNLLILSKGGYFKINNQSHFLEPVSESIQLKVNQLKYDIIRVNIILVCYNIFD
jgi:hypothetical protein